MRLGEEVRLLGFGVAFPASVTPQGGLGSAAGREHVRQCVRAILLTAPGERLMMPDFGVGLGTFAGWPNRLETWVQIQEHIERGLRRWESRVQVRAVRVQADPSDPERALVIIRYHLVAYGEDEELSLTVSLGRGDLE